MEDEGDEESKMLSECRIDRNYFDLFGLPINSYGVDVAKLKQRYNELRLECFNQNQIDELERAYLTLFDELQRAIYILETGLNICVKEQKIEDEEFVLEAEQLNQELDDCTETDQIQQVQSDVMSKFDEIIRGLPEQFIQEDYQTIVQEVIKAMQLEELMERIQNQEDKIWNDKL